MNIILIGYRGSGKTSVGRELARLLDRPLFDSDRMVFAKTGRTVREIVEGGGWPAFREAEKSVIAELASLDQAVISLGGGSVMDSDNISVLAERGTFVWLKADAHTLADRMKNEQNGNGQRPSLTGAGTLEEIARILAERLPVYRAVADLAVDTSGKFPADIAAEIAAALVEGPQEHRARKGRRKRHGR